MEGGHTNEEPYKMANATTLENCMIDVCLREDFRPMRVLLKEGIAKEQRYCVSVSSIWMPRDGLTKGRRKAVRIMSGNDARGSAQREKELGGKALPDRTRC